VVVRASSEEVRDGYNPAANRLEGQTTGATLRLSPAYTTHRVDSLGKYHQAVGMKSNCQPFCAATRPAANLSLCSIVSITVQRSSLIVATGLEKHILELALNRGGRVLVLPQPLTIGVAAQSVLSPDFDRCETKTALMRIIPTQ